MSAHATARSLSTRPRWALRDAQPQPIVPANEAATAVHLNAVASPPAARSLSCCLIGPTNAGKSTMLNRLVDSDVSIVSSKIHTTRQNTLGFLTDTALSHRPTQVEFIDAPGALGPRVPELQRAIWEAVRAADLALVVVDASDKRPLRAVVEFLSQLGGALDAQERNGEPRTRTALVLNKVDRVHPKERLLELSQQLHAAHTFDWPCLMVSALKGYGMPELRGWLLLQARPGEWTVPEGVTHLQSPLHRATEIIRSCIFAYCDDELPYALSQRNLGWTELRNGDLRIDQEIVVPDRASTRAIVRKRLPGISKAARPTVSKALGRNVHLFLTVSSSGERL